MDNYYRWIFRTLATSMLFFVAFTAVAEQKVLSDVDDPPYLELELSFANTPIEQAFEMLSGLGQVSIIMNPEVQGSVTANLFEHSIDAAIRTIADAAGFAVEKRSSAYVVMSRDDVGKDTVGDMTAIRSYKIQYLDTGSALQLLEKYLSRYGTISTIEGRKRIVVSDRPEFLDRIERVLSEVDIEPQQILIEAEILEIALNDDEVYGIDWTSKAAKGKYGSEGLSNLGSTGFVMEYLTDDLDIFLQALSGSGRVRTLSTPKLLVLEDQDAEVIIGDRIGFKVTTTIDSVTSESVEFIESGVILRVKAAVDNHDRIMLDVHPEVSSGTINDGIPSISTTEVTTQLIANNGEPIFIGGLIKNAKTERETGVPGLRSIPIVGGLFSQTEDRFAKTETIVVIRPYLVNQDRSAFRRELTRSVALGQQLKQDVEPEASVLDLDNGISFGNNDPEAEAEEFDYYALHDDVPVDEDYVSQQEVRDVKSTQQPSKDNTGNRWGWILGVLTVLVLL